MARTRAQPVLAVLVCGTIVLGVAHALAIWPHYHLGSFDDDASYVLVARALAHGHGLTSALPTGIPLAATYPPGYSLLLVPIALVSGTAFAAFRGLSVGLVPVVLLLTWAYLRRRGVSAPLSLAVLLLLALNPVLGTFSVMVMAELPFIAVFLVALLALERWESSDALVTWPGFVAIISAAYLVWLKEAGAGLVIGLVLWLCLRRLWPKALALAAGTGLLFFPVVIARVTAGTNLLGSRYTLEFGSAFQGSLVHLVSHAISTYANTAIPQSVVPTRVHPWPVAGVTGEAVVAFATLTAPLVVVGFVVGYRRCRDAAYVAVPVYLLETLVFPFTNERRVILVLPLVLLWYVLGWATVIGWAGALVRRARPLAWAAPAGWAVPAVALVILVPQFNRDFLLRGGGDTTRPLGSPYMAMTARLGQPGDVVETDYLWTTGLATGHRTGTEAYYASTSLCYGPALERSLLKDQAAFLLSAALHNAGAPASPCLLEFAATDPNAVRLLRTDEGHASVFEFVGPNTPHPNLRDVTAGVRPVARNLKVTHAPPQARGDPGDLVWETRPARGQATFSISWGKPEPVRQVSVGMAAPTSAGRVTHVALQLRVAGGAWRTMATAWGPVGLDGAVPFLLAAPTNAVRATAVRVAVLATAPVSVSDVHVLAGR